MSTALEQHYTPKQVAASLGLTPRKVRDMFREEPGVLCLGSTTARKVGKRYVNRRVTLRISESALSRVRNRLKQQ